jgi:hypothetical protein
MARKIVLTAAALSAAWCARLMFSALGDAFAADAFAADAACASSVPPCRTAP